MHAVFVHYSYEYYSVTVSYPMSLKGPVPSLPSMMTETGLTTDPASMLVMLAVDVSVRSPVLTVSLKS